MADSEILPLYVRIEQMLLRRIGTEFRQGDLLPTQVELTRETGASLITVKRAISELSRKGVLESRRGTGTIVRRERISDDHAEISSWTESISRFGGEPRTAWCTIDIRSPSLQRVRQLALASRRKTVVIRRLRLVDGSPLCLMTNEIALDLVPDLPMRGLDQESFYAVLKERYGITPTSAVEEITARHASATERKHLGRSASVVLVIRRRTFHKAGRALEVSKIIAPAARYRYRMQLTSRQS